MRASRSNLRFLILRTAVRFALGDPQGGAMASIFTTNLIIFQIPWKIKDFLTITGERLIHS